MNKKTDAKSNGVTLTVGFHNASPPLIWRFDLERNHSFTLALQGEESDWELGITAPKGDFYPVAHFTTREDAEEAFAKVEKALSCKKAATGFFAKAMLVLAALIVLVVLCVALFGFYVNHRLAATPIAASTLAPTVPQQPGVPLSADDVLQPPK